MDQAHEAGGAARGPAFEIDEQIMVMWRALRSNPSLRPLGHAGDRPAA
jgi:hypothetical protein